MDTRPNRIQCHFSKICNVFDGFEGISKWIWVIFEEHLKILTVLRQDRCVCKGFRDHIGVGIIQKPAQSTDLDEYS